MRETIFEVAEGETLGACATSPTPSRRRRRRWCGTCLRCRCGSFAHREGLEPYPIDALDGIVRWAWAMDTDFSEATAYKILAHAGEQPQVSGGNPPRPRAGVAECHQLRRQRVKYIGNDGVGVGDMKQRSMARTLTAWWTARPEPTRPMP